MHRIVMVPLAAPDKAVALEDLDDPARDAVVVRNRLLELPAVLQRQ